MSKLFKLISKNEKDQIALLTVGKFGFKIVEHNTRQVSIFFDDVQLIEEINQIAELPCGIGGTFYSVLVRYKVKDDDEYTYLFSSDIETMREVSKALINGHNESLKRLDVKLGI
jgi:hypothetical protein